MYPVYTVHMFFMHAIWIVLCKVLCKLTTSLCQMLQYKLLHK